MKQKNVILMVVAVGCGLVAAFLTSQMSARGTVEQVDVLVAAKDLPVGTMITRDEIDKYVKTKRMPKDGLPPQFVTEKETLVDKRLSRPMHVEETFNPQDLLKGGAITLPPGYGMVSMPVTVGQAAAGFVGPGSRVNVLATLRLTKTLYSFRLLSNMLVVAVNTKTTIDPGNGGAFPNMNMVSFAVKEKEAMVLSLARTRGCTLELFLRHPETSSQDEKNDKLEDVIKLLSDDRIGEKAGVVGGEDTDRDGEKKKTDSKKKSEPESPQVAPAPTIAVVKVPVAKKDIAANTMITADLIADAFEIKELPKDYAGDAVIDFNDLIGKAFKSGVSKNQWVTRTMVGEQAPKDAPHDAFSAPKPGPTDAPKKPDVKTQPVQKKNYHDVAVHTGHGTVIHRYEEYAPGKWRKVSELNQAQATRDESTPVKPGAGGKKTD